MRIIACMAVVLAALSASPLLADAAARAMAIEAGYFEVLQEALDAVPEAGGIVRIPPGEYHVSEPLVLSRGDTRVEGSGAATHIVNDNAEGAPAFVVRPAGRGEDPEARLWRVQLADFRISGNPASGDGLLCEGVDEVYISGLAIDHNGGHGINLVDCYEDPRVSDSIITYNAQAGLNLEACHDIVVNANQFEENQDAVRCLDSFNLCMNGNNLDDHLRHGVVIENTYGSVLSGSMIEECQGIAVVMDRDCYGNTVSANVIAHNGGGGVHLLDAWGCAISANTFTMEADHAVYVGPEAGRITISANNFSNAHIGGETKRDDAATGIMLESCPDIVITGNLFAGLSTPAVTATEGAKRICVTGNTVVDAFTAEAQTAFDLEGATEALIQANTIQPGAH